MRYLWNGASFLSVALFCLQAGSQSQIQPHKPPAAPRASGVQLQTPAAGQTVSGTLQLTLSGDLSKVAKVYYKMGRHFFATSAVRPFSVTWNSALSADGNVQIETVAFDILGNILADTITPVIFSNYGNKAEILSPGFPATLTGSVSINLHAFDALHSPAYWTSAIDGEVLPVIFTDQVGQHDQTQTQTIDTTIYPNGPHEFYFAFHSNDYNNPNPPPGNENFRGMVMQLITMQNGKTYMDVVANYLHVYTAVGGNVTLGCTRFYTDNSTGACQTPVWIPTDPTVASVDSTGKLTALKTGYTDVTLTDGNRSTLIHVWVPSTPGVPHFTTNGGTSTTYVAGQSTFIIAPFLLAPNYVSADPNLLAETRRAGINTLTTGIYLNPTDLTTTFANWLPGYNATVNSNLQLASSMGFRVIGTGDNIARNPGVEAYRSLNWPQGKQAIQYAIQNFAQSGTAVSVEMIDEAAFIWGPNPTPPGLIGAANSMQSIACTGSTCTVTWPNLSDNSYHDTISNGLTFTITGNPLLNNPSGTTYTVQNATTNTFTFTPAVPVTGTFTPQSNPNTEFEWFARATTCNGSPCVPPVLDSALATLNSWVKTATPTVPVSYPAGGIVLTSGQRNWMGPGSLADYASQYWDTGQQRPTYIFGKGVRESSYWMLNSFYSRQPYMQLNKPQLMQIGISDVAYIKNSPSGTDGYNPPVDTFQSPGGVSRSVGSSMFSAICAGVAGLRLYQFEDSDDYQAEVSGGPGGSYQTGAAPFYGATNLWQAMGYAGALITNVLQPYILSPPVSSPALGRNIITGVRTNSTGTMLIVVNGWDSERTINVPFTPYKYGFGAVRYRVGDTWMKSDVLPDETGEALTLVAGETAVYIFPNAKNATGLTNVSFLPNPPLGSSQMVVTYGYLYQQNVAANGNQVNCASGCVISVDRRVGDVYFQYTFLDPVNGASRKGPVTQLGLADTVSVSPPPRF